MTATPWMTYWPPMADSGKEEQAKKENDEKLVEEFDFEEIMDNLVIPEVA